MKLAISSALILLELMILQFPSTESVCCVVDDRRQCADGSVAVALCCGKGSCNVFCCNCDGGCKGSRSRGGGHIFSEMAAYRMMDLNGDGGVDEEEAFTYLGHLYAGNFSFYNYDADNDGYLSLMEIKQGYDY
jgi:hypothetical protein